MKILLEICVDTYESAVAAIEGGADRIELCSALSEGGLTPTIGLLRIVKLFLEEWLKRTGNIIPVYCMVRCRRGSDFQYSDSDMEIMLWDVKLLKDNGADGFVFGALDNTGNVHRRHYESELRANIKLIADLGFSTILTSGLKPSASEGVDSIQQMQLFIEDIKKETGKDLQLMPGSGVSSANVATILSSTGCRAIHGSASIPKPSSSHIGTISMGGTNVDAQPLKICSKHKVAELRQLIDGL